MNADLRPTPTNPNATNFNPHYLLAGFIILGIALRISCYLANRSLWGDEVGIASNIIQRNFTQLTHPLDNSQYASIGFRWLLKISSLLISPDSYGLRFIPMLAGVLSVPVFALLARRLFGDFRGARGFQGERGGRGFRGFQGFRGPGIIAVALFAINPWLVTYAAQCKAYSIEVLAAALAAWLALRVMDSAPPAPDPTPRLLVLALATAAMAWLAPAAAFIAGGTWVVVTLWVFANHRSARTRAVCLASAVAVLASTLGSLRAASMPPETHKYMLDFWDHMHAFPPAPWDGWAALAWYPEALRSFFRQGFGIVTPYLAGGLLLIGTVALCRRQRWGAALLLAPLAPLLLAGYLHLYPLLAGNDSPAFLPSNARLLLFLTPAATLLLAQGLAALTPSPDPTQFNRISFPALVLLALLIAAPLTTTVQHAIRPPNFQDMRAAWHATRARLSEKDILYVNPGGYSELVFYSQLYPPPFAVIPTLCTYDPRPIAARLDQLQSQGRTIPHVWVVFTTDENFVKYLPGVRAGIEQAIARDGRHIENKETLDFADVQVCVYTLDHATPQ